MQDAVSFIRVSPKQMFKYLKYWEKHISTAGFFLTIKIKTEVVKQLMLQFFGLAVVTEKTKKISKKASIFKSTAVA